MGGSRQAADLRTLAYRLIQMANDMDRTSEFNCHMSSHYEEEVKSEKNPVLDYEIFATVLYQQRRKRNRYFSSKIFSEPAWDILLDLFIQNARNRPVSVTSACIAGEIPTTTGLRWIKILETEGLVEREGSDTDARITWLRLTPKAVELMKQFIDDGIQALEALNNELGADRELEPAYD
jgi:DNA-binding MarR family transcriptional regulator